MKKKILFGMAGIVAMAVAAIAAVPTVNANFTESNLMSKNLEAITQNEANSCWSGGPGAIQCSIDAGTEILGVGVSAGCSVTCGNGYYACCSLRCTCKLG